MNKTLRILTDFAAGFSVTTWISGPLFEEYGLRPAVAQAGNHQQKKALLAVYRSYDKIAEAGMAGLVLTDTVKFFSDDLRKKGTPAYKRWATLGDLLVLASMGSQILKNNLRKQAQSEQVQLQLDITRRLSLGLSSALLLVSALQYYERTNAE